MAQMNGRGSIFLKKSYQIYIIVINTWTKGHVLLPHKENAISCRGGGMDYFSSFSFHGLTGSRGSVWGLEPLEAGQWGSQCLCVEEVSLNPCSTKLCVKKIAPIKTWQCGEKQADNGNRLASDVPSRTKCYPMTNWEILGMTIWEC